MTSIKWKHKRPYVYREDGVYLGTYRDYRFMRPCGTYSTLPRRRGTMLTGWKVAMLHGVDIAARRAWDRSHPNGKC